MIWLAVAAGGSFGALARFGIAQWMSGFGLKWPLATFSANILGSFLMGLGFVIIVEKTMLPDPWRHLLLVGFLGAFTTFSTFAIETLTLIEAEQWKTAIIYWLSSCLATIMVAFLGATLARQIF
ncbi:MAG: CrcB protein [Flavobacteriales bacterium]|jgi:CrcB protein